MPTPTPQAKVNMEPNFEKRLRDAKNAAAEEYAQRQLGGQVKWDRPEGWDGDLFDYAAMGKAFSRDTANQECLKAISDPAAPGTTGDVVAATTMIDYLASMEQAFRSRHTMRRCRATAQMLGRKAGHGSDSGPLVKGSVEYIRTILRQARTPQ